jgi:LysR family transcriptional regulator, cyn operon transcriptional activator
LRAPRRKVRELERFEFWCQLTLQFRPGSRELELRQLDMLKAVADSGGYKGAGELLHLSHPAVHRQIRMLEEELGERVFHRAGRRVQPTEAGLRLIALADRLHREIGQALSEIRDLSELERGGFRLGTSTTVLMFFLPNVLHRFRQKHSKVSLHVATSTVSDIFHQIVTGDLDLGLVFSPRELPNVRPELIEELLYEEEFVLSVGANHPLAHCRAVSPADLRGVPLLGYSPHSTLRQYIDLRLRGQGVEPLISMELENEETIAKMLQTNGGAAFLSMRRAVADNVRHFRIRGLALRCPVCLIYLKKGYLSRAAHEFMRMCKEECRV